jgi:hypothetical protein
MVAIYAVVFADQIADMKIACALCSTAVHRQAWLSRFDRALN